MNSQTACPLGQAELFCAAWREKQKTPAPDDVPFEEGLKKLETIVEQMEGDEMPLEDLLEHYEEGIRLAKVVRKNSRPPS